MRKSRIDPFTTIRIHYRYHATQATHTHHEVMPEEGARDSESAPTMPGSAEALHWPSSTRKSGRPAPHLLVHLISQSFWPAGLTRCGASSGKALGRLGPNIFSGACPHFLCKGTPKGERLNEHADCVHNVLDARSLTQRRHQDT
jgi:hypothetical protein